MNIQKIQQSIVERLDQQFTIAVLPFLSRNLPEGNAQYDLGLKNPIAYVVFVGSQADPSNSTYVVSQPRRLKFHVECHSRYLYDTDSIKGLHTLRDVIEQALIGFRPVDCQPLYLIQDDSVKTEDGIWVHVLQFECQSMLVQKDVSEPIVVPQFKEILTPE